MDKFELDAHYRAIFLQEGLSGKELQDAINRVVGNVDSNTTPAPVVPSEPRKAEPQPTQPKLPF